MRLDIYIVGEGVGLELQPVERPFVLKLQVTSHLNIWQSIMETPTLTTLEFIFCESSKDNSAHFISKPKGYR